MTAVLTDDRGSTGPLGLVLLVLAAYLLPGCGHPEASSSSNTPDQADPPRHVETVCAAVRPLERVIVSLGTLAPFEQATLSTKVPGRLESILVDLGDPVQKGQLIAQIDPRDYRLRVEQAEALLAQARVRLGLPLDGSSDEITLEEVSAVKQARALLDEAEANRRRVEALADQNIISRSELETADAAYKVAASRYETALQEARNQQAVIAQRRAELKIALENLADTAIYAPFDGAVQTRSANAGEYHEAASPLVTLVRIDPLRLQTDISEREAFLVKPGQKVRLTVEGSSTVYSGVVKRLSPGLDERSRMLRVEADIPNPGDLRPGLFAEVSIVVDEQSPGILVPKEAIATFAGLEKVFVVADGKAVERPITTGSAYGEEVEILSGLKDGEIVVLSPGGLRNGDPVVAVSGPAQTAGLN